MDTHKKKLITRRDALQRGLIGAAGLACAGALPQEAFAAQAPRAKSVIQIWMWGGPAHLDTFDPKPDAGTEYCGPFKDVLATNVSGMQINAQLPMLARQADKYSIIRSMTHGVNAHETASYMVQTGHEVGRIVYPSQGAVVSKLLGYDNGYNKFVPPYVCLTQPQGRFSEAGFLGQQYQPFATGGDPGKGRFVVEGIVSEKIWDARQNRRRELLHSLDTLGNTQPENGQFELFDQSENNAYDLMFGEARELFDLSKENDAVRDAYGRNTFGQSCLMARKLVEYGVPYVTINYKGWDTHKQHFQLMGRQLPEMDRGMATLLQDLTDRGLLDSTIVWWTGEFGRTPKIQWDPPWNGGRGHFGHCFSSVLAGGGFQGGQIVGASDATGSEVRERPVYPQDVHRSIYRQLGIDPDGPLPNPRGMDLPIMPPADQGMGSLKELT
jgi:hypothetical protein